jgi:regulatory protein
MKKLQTFDEEEKKEKALKYAYRILRMRMKTYFEIKQKLKQRKTEPEIIEFVIKKLEEQELLNDEKFAEAWIKDRLHFHPCGRLLINKKMREKGIDEKIIKKNLDKFLPPEKEKKLAMEILEQKRKKMKSDLPEEKIFQKLNMFLSGKGFPGNIIFDVLNQ